MKKTWWVSALVAVALMFASSSRPYFTIYQPWSWTREHNLDKEGASRFSLPVNEVENAAGLPRTAIVEIKGFEQVDDENDLDVFVPDGFDGWVLYTKWKAPTNSLLSGCQVWFSGADGRHYELSEKLTGDSFGGASAVRPDEVRISPTCTPPMQSGPRYNWLDGKLENEFPRPETWDRFIAVSMPDGVRPTEFHFGWSPPHYITLELPENAPFLDELLGDAT
ncbi:hypothetical protein CAFEA_01615 [Corynebacterium afermentans subsp. afermentans]|uniref:Secreted protein n=1 Tax=Corynebacterium afermentans TaxID=38286 RepID=A0A9X8R4R8_9CORY|nr:hypothetical protein [Corynebacterium afermentans]WJY55946.1 hypothetical protein CAFEA_01615 [Corynebacterium afermentans subsp. afermentans]SIQ37298.1 hypothetical protein SAMN05421802_11272 [Corynebacterium afermentans]